MSAQKTKDTTCELALRRELHARGLRYRLHQPPVPTLRRHADIVFRNAKVAVFVDGCFWHGCPEHGTSPQANADWWKAKLERNQERDRETDARLADAGWFVIRVWEHEAPAAAARRVEAALRRRVARPSGASRP